MTQPFETLASPVRRRILEMLADGPRPSGDIVQAIRREVDISQPGVSQHLAMLREQGFVSVSAEGARRVYELAPDAFAEVDAWLDRVRSAWGSRLDALATEVARGKRERRLTEAQRPTRRRA